MERCSGNDRCSPYVIASIPIFSALAVVFAIAAEQQIQFIYQAFQAIREQVEAVRSAYQ